MDRRKSHNKILFFSLGVASLLIVLGISSAQGSADTSSWLSTTSNPSLVKDKELGPTESLPTTVAGQGNIDCANRTVITRPKIVPFQSEITANDCFVKNAFGIYGGSGLLKIDYTNVAGPITNFSGTFPTGLFAIPGSLDVIHLSSGNNNGVALRLTKNALSKITVNPLSTSEVKFAFNQAPDTTLRDKADNLVSAQTNSLAFSENGKWLVVDAPGKGMVRVNAETFEEIIPFAPPFNYNIGVDPGGKTAVSNDGRYVVVASRNFSIFKIYDLNTCGSVPNNITTFVTCQSRDLWPFMQTQLPGFLGAFNVRFLNNEVVELYGLSNIGAGNKLAKFRLAAPGKQVTGIQYLALGDSYISGEGTYLYKSGTNTTPNKCHLSPISYPYLIKQQLSIDYAESVACSGAKIDDILTNSENYRGQTDDKNRDERTIDEVLGIVSNYMPGHIAQHEFITEYRPEIITISTVGNDIGFGDKIKRCLEPDTCYESYEDRYEVMQLVRSKFDELVTMYKTIKDKAAADARIYAIGYPSVAASDANCATNVLLNNSELEFSNLLVDYLNYVVNLAAQRAEIGYVDVSDALAGHRLCEASDDELAVNGISAGDDAPIDGVGPLGKESFHPNILGHQLLKAKILQQTNNLTSSMYTNGSQVVVPEINDSAPLLAQAPRTGRQIHAINYNDDLSDDIVVRGGVWNVVLESIGNIRPLSNVSVFLNSDPVNLGTFTTSSMGTLNTEVFIPESVAPGFHTLHLYGVNFLGEPVDIQKIIYVAASENDYDGDGIPNAQEKCLAVEPSNTDQDMDGTDDACDSQIDEAPTPPSVNFVSPDFSQTQGGTIQLVAEASDEHKVESVAFLIDGAEVGQDTEAPYSIDLDTMNLTNGQHTITAVAKNNFGLTTSSSATLTVYNLPPPPTIEITNPTNNSTVSGTVQIIAGAQDAEGVAGVQFKIDGTNLGTELTMTPYAYDWDSKTTANGSHTISATVRSVNGQTGEGSITVNVQNQTTPPPPEPSPLQQLIQKIVKVVVKIVTTLLSLFRR